MMCAEKATIEVEALAHFLRNWDADYLQKINEISLFNPKLTRCWSLEQKQYFVKIFYHSRGHFRDFLWYMGNFAPNKQIKTIILENIAEEFNEEGLSHEQLYLDYARTLGVDLTQDIVDEVHYLPEMKQFNRSHLAWMTSKNWKSQFSAFAAYERLDATDYTALSQLHDEEHMFFRVHRLAKHFDKTYGTLQTVWEENPFIVEEAFVFIADTQITMWRDLSNAVFGLHV